MSGLNSSKNNVSARIINIATLAVSIGVATILIALSVSKGLQHEIENKTGIFNGHPNGYGFLTPKNNDQGGDIYIAPKQTSGAMHQDKVIVRIESHNSSGRPEGRIMRILERSTTSLVGLFEPLDGNGWVIPMNNKYFYDILS